MPIIKLLSKDNVVYDVDIQIAKLSDTIKTMLEDLGDDDVHQTPVPLYNIESTILQKIIHWATYFYSHKSSMDKEWIENFFCVDQSILYEIILGANYLQMKDLLEMSCEIVANMMIDKTPEELRNIFNVKNDYSPNEEEQVRKENQWCE